MPIPKGYTPMISGGISIADYRRDCDTCSNRVRTLYGLEKGGKNNLWVCADCYNDHILGVDRPLTIQYKIGGG